MIRVILLYALFLIGGMAVLIVYKSSRKDQALFICITTLGAALWGSIIMRQPLDLNRAIAWVLTRWQ
jgi:uncharacterized membrane protein